MKNKQELTLSLFPEEIKQREKIITYLENNIHEEWKPFVLGEAQKKYFQETMRLLKQDKELNVIYPNLHDVFNVFKHPLENIKCVIVGQDPYFKPNMAIGYAFASRTLTPSLDVIFSEIEEEYGKRPTDTTLSSWIEQGVFLLNIHLTVRKGKPLSHEYLGWSTFTRNTIKYLCKKHPKLIFLLWGQYARFNEEIITSHGGIVFTDVHPASNKYNKDGFIGNNHFKEVNYQLKLNNKQEIIWV